MDCLVVPMDKKPGESEPLWFRGEIGIEDGRFAYVGPPGTIPANWTPDETIKASGMAALPGLVNAHTHAAMTLFRGYADDLPLKEWLEEKIWPLEAGLQPGDVYWGTQLALLEMIRTGTTCFADMYFFMDQVAEAAVDAGIRACLSHGLIGVSETADKALKISRAFVKRWHNEAGGRITTMLGPHAPYTCPPGYLRRVVDLAAELEVPIHIHVAETAEERENILGDYKKSPVQLLEEVGLFNHHVLAAHCVHVSDEDIAILAEKKVGVAHNPQSNLKLASGIAPVPKMIARGVNVGLGTDGAASNNNLDMFEEMRTCALIHKGITGDPTVVSAYEALSMATVGGARALGLEHVGVIAPGMKADLILVDMDRPNLIPRHNVVANLVYSALGSDVDTVIVDGKIIMSRGVFQTIDAERVYREAEKRARRLAG